jgi:hypothetical protein
MPDIEKLLWPRSVAIFIVASSDTRGRIVQIMRGRIIARGLGLP